MHWIDVHMRNWKSKNKYAIQTKEDLVAIQRLMYVFYLIIITMSNAVF